MGFKQKHQGLSQFEADQCQIHEMFLAISFLPINMDDLDQKWKDPHTYAQKKEVGT